MMTPCTTSTREQYGGAYCGPAIGGNAWRQKELVLYGDGYGVVGEIDITFIQL